MDNINTLYTGAGILLKFLLEVAFTIVWCILLFPVNLSMRLGKQYKRIKEIHWNRILWGKDELETTGLALGAAAWVMAPFVLVIIFAIAPTFG